MLLQWQNGLHFIDQLWCHIVNDVDDRAFRRSIFCELQQFTKATYYRTDSVITFKLATVTYKAGGRDSRRFFPTASTITNRQETYDQPQPYYCSKHQPLLCSLLMPFRSRHLVCGIPCTYTHSLKVD